METVLEGKSHIGCKWNISVKHKPDGTIDRFKARLVAKGYAQTYGIDNQEMFSPIAKMNTMRVLLSLTANLNQHLYQLDIKKAFLNGKLQKEVYMQLPLSFEENYGRENVCNL